MPHRLSLPGFLLALAPACGEPPAGEPLSLVPAQSLTFDLDLEIPSFAADPALDVIVSWEAATAGML
ncbi:MAG: hypothetical protein JXB39_11995, partial [Deltaproteobacteria bacterium]|nr:hypothetical protein [Deltaproteobacteria bacterium]